MGIFNEHSTTSKSGQGGKQIRGAPGVGFKFKKNGDFDLQNKKIVNIANPSCFNDSVNYMTMKAQSLLLDGTNHMTSNLNTYGHSIENLKSPTTNRHAVNKEYVDNNYIPKNSEINMTGNNIVNLANGTNSQDAINKGQLDNAIATIHTKGKDIDLQDN